MKGWKEVSRERNLRRKRWFKIKTWGCEVEGRFAGFMTQPLNRGCGCRLKVVKIIIFDWLSDYSKKKEGWERSKQTKHRSILPLNLSSLPKHPNLTLYSSYLSPVDSFWDSSVDFTQVANIQIGPLLQVWISRWLSRDYRSWTWIQWNFRKISSFSPFQQFTTYESSKQKHTNPSKYAQPGSAFLETWKWWRSWRRGSWSRIL